MKALKPTLHKENNRNNRFLEKQALRQRATRQKAQIKNDPEAVSTDAPANAFEQLPSLTAHIQRMASTGVTGTMIEWDDFLRDLNAAIARAQPCPRRHRPRSGESK